MAETGVFRRCGNCDEGWTEVHQYCANSVFVSSLSFLLCPTCDGMGFVPVAAAVLSEGELISVAADVRNSQIGQLATMRVMDIALAQGVLAALADLGIVLVRRQL